MYKMFKANSASFEQTALQVVPVSVDMVALGQSQTFGTYALLTTGEAPVNYRTGGAISGPDGATNAMYLPPNSQIIIRVEAGETLSWKHATNIPGTFNVTFGSLL